MFKLKKYYNLVILLIMIGAFPVSIAAVTNSISGDSMLCTFHGESFNDNKVIINCDHCVYYYDDVESGLLETPNYSSSQRISVYHPIHNRISLSVSIESSSRSPPIS